MGNEASLPLDMCATFDAEEIKRLGKRQVSLCFILTYTVMDRTGEEIGFILQI